MAAVQPRSLYGGDEELGSVCVWTSVRHCQQEWLVKRNVEILIVEGLAVDRLTASSIVEFKVTTLSHEVRDDSVELNTLVAHHFSLVWRGSVLSALADSHKVLDCLWDHISVESKDNLTYILSSNFDVKEYFLCDCG